MSSETGRVYKADEGAQAPKKKPAPTVTTDNDTVNAEKTDAQTGRTRNSGTKTETKCTEKTRNSGGKTEGKTETKTEAAETKTKVDEERKKDGSGGKKDGSGGKKDGSGGKKDGSGGKKDGSGGKTEGAETKGTEGKGSGGKLSETGRGSDPPEERTGREPAAPAAAAPPTPTSAPRAQSVKTAKSSSVTAAKGGPSNGRKSGTPVMAKPSDPRVKTAGSASSTTKGSSGSTPTDGTNKTRTPVKSIDSVEKSCIAPSNVAAPPSWHLGWPIAGLFLAILLALFLVIAHFVIAKWIATAAENEELEKMASPPSPSQRVARQKRHFGTTSDRVRLRVREPPDPSLP